MRLVMMNDVTVLSRYGIRKISFDVAVSLMDEDLREELHFKLSPCTEQEFFDAYAEAHEQRFGESWVLDDPHPCY